MTSETTALPDDPRECCKAILTELRKVDSWPVAKLPQDFAAMVRALCGGDPDYLMQASPALMRMADQAEDAAKLYHSIVETVWELARHGTGEHREADRRMAEGKPAYGGPTYCEVKAARKALASVGKIVTDTEAVELLKDEAALTAKEDAA